MLLSTNITRLSADQTYLIGHLLFLVLRQVLLYDVVAVVDGVEETLDHVPEVGGRLHPLVEVRRTVGQVEDLLDGGELLVRGVKLLVRLHRLGLECLPALQIVWKLKIEVFS